MARRRYSNRRSRSSRSPGLDQALQHIEEARRLSAELGGTDRDVKQYLFNLIPTELKMILDAYERQYGQVAREYAEITLPQWRSGKRKMSGLVAGRLFALLPAFMPIQRKFDLVKSLWEAKCPHSRKTFYIGSDADSQEVAASVKRHLQEVVQNYEIPESIAQRFRWLAQDDVKLQQELHNYFLQLNREVLSVAADDRVQRLLTTMRADGIAQRISQSICIGNHQLDLVFDPVAPGVSIEKPNTRILQSGSGCLAVIIFVILVTAAVAKAIPSEWSRALPAPKSIPMDRYESDYALPPQAALPN